MFSSEALFSSEAGFCSDCGSALPLLREQGGVQCFMCSKTYPIEVFEDTAPVRYTIHFNSVKAKEENMAKEMKRKKGEEEDEGPVIERKCPKCGNDKMSYATLQLRSADEGQTVFYTCTKCKHKESENS